MMQIGGLLHHVAHCVAPRISANTARLQRRIITLSVATVAALLAACGTKDSKTVLTVYSPHGKDLLQHYKLGFEKANPDVRVDWLDIGSQEILERVRAERENPQADVWFGAPTEMFERAALEGLLAQYMPTWRSALAPAAEDPTGLWHGTYLTPEVIAYNSDKVDSASAPRDWNQLLDVRWKGHVVIRDPVASGTMRAIFGGLLQRSMENTGKTDSAWAFLKRLDAATSEYTPNPAILYEKLQRGDGWLTMYDMPDIAMLQQRLHATNIKFNVPSSGTPLLVDAIAVIKGAKHPDVAQRYIEFVTTIEALKFAADSLQRIPARVDMPDSLLPAWGARCESSDSANGNRSEVDARLIERLDASVGCNGSEQQPETVSATTRLALDRLARRYDTGGGVDDISLDVPAGELLALVGASGSGKTTTLRLVAGYEKPDSGRLLLDGRNIEGLPAEKRGFGMVFQHYALFPHLSVVQNVAFGLEARGVKKAERIRQAEEALSGVGLGDKAGRPVQALSGGEQQRVALARALVIAPPVLLLDEPLSNLDPTLRRSTRDELRQLLRRQGVTALFVTHDQEDAFAVADRVAFLSGGKLQQVGTPESLYDTPASQTVAQFIGHAALVPARFDGKNATITRGGRTQTVAATAGSNVSHDALAVLRPEFLHVQAESGRDNDAWLGTIVSRRFLGGSSAYRVTLNDGLAVEVSSDDRSLNEGDAVYVTVARAPVALVPA